MNELEIFLLVSCSIIILGVVVFAIAVAKLVDEIIDKFCNNK